MFHCEQKAESVVVGICDESFIRESVACALEEQAR